MAGLHIDAAVDDRSYRLLLKRASDSLSKRNITTIKFLCADFIAASKIEKISTGISIWKELEDQCLLGMNDYSRLTELLYHAERRDLIRQLTNTNADVVQTRIKEGHGKLPQFRVFLNKLCQEIPQKHLEEVKYLFSSDLSNSAREGAPDMWSLLLLLERQDMLGPGKLSCLSEIVNIIGRQDLFDYIGDFKARRVVDDDDYMMTHYDEEKLIESSDDSMVDLRSSSGDYTSSTSLNNTTTSTGNTSQSENNVSNYQSERLSTPIQATGDYTEGSAFSPNSSASNIALLSNPNQQNQQSNGTSPQSMGHGLSLNSSAYTGPQITNGSNGSVDDTTVPYMQFAAQHQASDDRYIITQYPDEEYTEETQLHSDMSEASRATSSPKRQYIPEPSREAIAEVSSEVGVSMVESADDYDETLQSLELPCYRMDSEPRGYCVIINNKEFIKIPGDKNSKKLENRQGSDVDAEKLETTFTHLGFRVLNYPNCSVEKMDTIFKTLSHNRKVLQKHNALVVCILSHGKFGAVYGSKGYEMKIGQVLGHFKPDNCPALAHKPKIFFVAACQGKEKQMAAHVSKLHTDDATTEIDDDLPKDADFLIGYATVPGYVSYRHEDDGTWYIRTLVERLNKWAAKEDLMAIMIDVNRKVAQHSAPDGAHTYKQMPLPYTTLTKKIFLKPVTIT